LGAYNVIETDSLLVKCPRCGAWPMAANLPKASASRREIRFRCPECHYQEAGYLQRAGNVQPLAEQHSQAQGR
jgi:DNA-directed RNA polymerase subunit M/transcription elongation factor TFIIS